jgi:hemerythrin-like domain-containing protein
MCAVRESMSFDALDACHQQIHQHIEDLALLAVRVFEAGSVDAQAQQQARVIETFFSETARQHHAEEEQKVFPPLLNSGRPELQAAVRSLQQDHGWIEENWIALAPQLRAIASGSSWIDMEQFQHSVRVFHDLLAEHIALEESLIYPESKAHWAQLLAARAARLQG